MEKSNKLNGLQTTTMSLFLGCLVIFILIVGKDFLLPIVWAAVISLASIPLIQWVRDRIPMRWGLITGLYLFVLLFVLAGIVYFFYYEVKAIITTIPDLDGKILKAEERLIGWLASVGINLGDKSFDLNYLTSAITKNTGVIVSFAGGVGNQLGKLFLVLLYSFFIIFYKDSLAQFYELRTQNVKKLEGAKVAVRNLVEIIGNYLSGILLITVAMGVMLYVLFLLLGLDYALFWALFIAALSVIPYIGIPMGIVLIVIFTFLTNDGYLTTLLTTGAILLANVIQENVLRPLIVGDKLQLSAFMVFFSVMLGGAIWGVSGMILFTPLAGIVKIILLSKPKTKPFAVFFGRVDEKADAHWNLFSRKNKAED